MSEEQCKKAYDDWLELLKMTNNEHLLKDPYNIWLESWHVNSMLNEKS